MQERLHLGRRFQLQFGKGGYCWGEGFSYMAARANNATEDWHKAL